MDWGNAIVRSKEVDTAGTITSITMELNLEGDFRKTKKKITWLAQPTPEHPLPSVKLVDFDYLITKKKLEENDNVADFVTPVSEFKEFAVADANVLDLKRGEIIQFERKGYYIYDNEADGVREFFKIPDGRAAGIASKAGPPIVAAAPVATPEKAAEAISPPPASSMYTVEKVYGNDVIPGEASKMYKVGSIYKD